MTPGVYSSRNTALYHNDLVRALKDEREPKSNAIGNHDTAENVPDWAGAPSIDVLKKITTSLNVNTDFLRFDEHVPRILAALPAQDIPAVPMISSIQQQRLQPAALLRQLPAENIRPVLIQPALRAADFPVQAVTGKFSNQPLIQADTQCMPAAVVQVPPSGYPVKKSEFI